MSLHKQAVNNSTLDVKPNELMWSKSPVIGEWDTSTWHRWDSLCLRFRVFRIVHRSKTLSDPSERLPSGFAAEILKVVNRSHTNSGKPIKGGQEFTYWDSVEFELSGGNYPKKYKSLRSAIEACEERKAVEQECDDIITNKEEVLSLAIEAGLVDVLDAPRQPRKPPTKQSQLRGDSTAETEDGRTPNLIASESDIEPIEDSKPTISTRKVAVMQISREDAIKLFLEIQFHTSERWDNAKMAVKAKGLAKLSFEEVSPETSESKNLLAKILKAVEDKDEIEITGDDSQILETKKASKTEEETNHKPKKEPNPPEEKKEKPAKVAKEPKPPKEKKAKKVKAPKEKVGLDQYGSRIGTARATLMGAITSTPKSMSQLIEETGLTFINGYYNYMRFWISKGFIVKVEQGYKLVSKD